MLAAGRRLPGEERVGLLVNPPVQHLDVVVEVIGKAFSRRSIIAMATG